MHMSIGHDMKDHNLNFITKYKSVSNHFCSWNCRKHAKPYYRLLAYNQKHKASNALTSMNK